MTRRIAGALAVICMSVSACSGLTARQDHPAAAPPTPDLRTLFASALAAQESDKPDQAEVLWKQVIAAAPGQAAPHTNLGIVYRTSGRLPEAVREYETAIRLDPADAVAYHNLGVAQRSRGAWGAAEQAYLRALELRPKQTETHYNLAILYDLFLDRPEDALTHYRQVLALGSPDADTVAQWIRTLERRLAPHEPAAPSAP